ncbi:YhgE/Pip domain-containing protein [Bacillus spongiae]|uniref:YhgE/Pip domain-containing protein n=1 Tax=Bacillus spongiae TaxID=2683610 RepID=A0ABU8HAZ6_9BACI
MKKSLLYAELRDIILNRKVFIPIIAVLFIPILYSGMFLWAFWDPYTGLDDLPVAVVNNDEGADFEGETLYLGEELVKELRNSRDFAYEFVEAGKGYEGLSKQDYYLLVEIPEDFSQNATSLLEKKPEKLSLNYVPNEGYNFLSAQIGESAINEIKASLSTSVSEIYAETMFDKISEMGSGITKAHEGAGELFDGASKLSDGTEELKNHLTLVASKSFELDSGVSQLQVGAQGLQKGALDLSVGISELNEQFDQISAGVTRLKAGTEELHEGVLQSQSGLSEVKNGMGEIISNTSLLEEGTTKLSSGVNELSVGVGMLEAQLTPLLESLPEEQKAQLQSALLSIKTGSAQLQENTESISSKLGLLNDAQRAALGGVNQLIEGSQKLSSGSSLLIDGQNELLSGLPIYKEGLIAADEGGEKLANSSKILTNGINTLYSGSQQLSDATEEIAKGSGDLVDGSVKLYEGSEELTSKLGEAAEEVNAVNADEETYNQIGEPVKVDKNVVNHVPNYGTGFAPYFLSLGLFVGALLISIVYPLREPALRPIHATSWFLSKFTVLMGVGILQSLIADAILLIGLDIQVENVGLFIITTIATSLTYIALIQVLVTVLGDPGRFIAIVILILQLTTSAGTFPIELIPSVLQPIGSYLPMTYSVSAFKAVISSGDFDFMWWNIGIMLIFMLGSMLLTAGFFKKLHKKQYFKQVAE